MNKQKKIYAIVLLLVLLFTLSGCANQEYITSPLGGSFGFWDIFVYPMAGIMWLIGQSIGAHNYALTIIFATLIVRTLAWPIYAKSNDMQLKMKIIQPEVDKIQAKYADKEDNESKQRMQMEMMQLYKKNGIGMGGCLMPLLQMPIFLGFYYAIRKLPSAMETEGHWLNIFTSTKLFGIDMTLAMNSEKLTESAVQTQKTGIIILAVLVGITQVISIIISELRQKKAQEQQQSNIPEYRRPKQNPQAKSSANMMKMMLYVFAIMMVVIVIQSPAGLGLYWVVGNIYSTLQAWIGHKNSTKRMEKLKAKHDSKF